MLDGIYQERWGFFMGELLVSGRVSKKFLLGDQTRNKSMVIFRDFPLTVRDFRNKGPDSPINHQNIHLGTI